MKKLLLILSFSVFVIACAAITLPEKIASLEHRAENGDPEAQYHLSTLYEHGFDSIPADTVKAHCLLQRAAEGGYAPAQNYLGFKLYHQNPDSATMWLRRAADSGDMKAASNLAYLLLLPDSSINEETRHNRDRQAAELYSQAARQGLPTALTSLADLYREGRGVEKDTVKAEELYLQAVSLNFPDAEKKLYDMNRLRYTRISPDEALSEGIRASRAGAYTVAFTLFSRAVENDNPKAHALLGDAYSSAKGTDYNHSLALKHYYSGATGGDPSAQFILAELLEIFPDALRDFEGITHHPAYNSPDYWYAKAAEGGVDSAREAFQVLFKFANQ